MTEHERQPAGWYRDPWDAAPARWWDGEEWTVEVASLKGGLAVPELIRDISTGTVWIWAIVLLPLISSLTLLATDPRAELLDLSAPVDPTAPGYTHPFQTFTWVDGINLLLPVVTVILAYIDWRTLRARGIMRPFPWAWSFFAFVVTSGVYVIGRGVRLRRQTGRGLGPVWVWIIVTVISIAVPFAYVMGELLPLLESELGTISPA